MEEAMELIYRIQPDYSGSLPESEACEIGPWWKPLPSGPSGCRG